ncbi:MAG: polysaccharide biosynthesis protein [Lachnospiraceae bacterium]|nr:polysaccharide biosynthesis protein [Lachnospiraceae bacterium]
MNGDNANKKSDTVFLVQGSILAAASIISRVVGMIYRLPMTAIIGKRGNDFYGTAYELYNILLIISSFSIPLAVSKLVASRLSKGQAKNALRVLKSSMAFASVSGGLAALIVFFGADYFTGTLLRTPLSAIALRVLAPVLFIVAIVGVLRGFFQGLNTMIPSAISQIAEQIVNAIVSVIAAYLLFEKGLSVGAVLGDKEGYAAAYGAAGGTLGTAMGSIAALLVMVFVYMIYRRVFRRRVLRDHTKNPERYRELVVVLVMTIIPVLLSATLYNISGIIDQGIFKNLANLQGYDPKQISEWWGVFTGQYKVVTNVPISIAYSIAASSVPSLTMAYHSKKMHSVRTQINLATRFIMLISFPCAVGIAVLGGPIMMLLFADSDRSSMIIMILGASSVVFYSLSTLTNGLLQGIDQMRVPVINAAIALVVQTVFLYAAMWIFHLHIYAVVLANTFYAFLMCVLNGYAVYAHSGARQDIQRTYLIPLEASAIMGLAVFVFYRIVHAITNSNAIACLLSIMVGGASYFVLILVLNGVSEEELRTMPMGTTMIRLAKRLGLL